MTILSHVRRQVEITTSDTRRLLVVFVVLVVFVAIGLVPMFKHAPQAIVYDRRHLTASPAAVCPGEKFTFPVDIVIERGDTSARITEGWCRANDGICPKVWQDDPYYVNFVDTYEIHVPAAPRWVPADLPVGEWQLRHCNEAHSDGLIDVTCYQVSVTVKDCKLPD